jgi:hypothetical protein
MKPEEIEKKLCRCGMPQSYPIPHEHDQTEREKQIIAHFKACQEHYANVTDEGMLLTDEEIKSFCHVGEELDPDKPLVEIGQMLKAQLAKVLPIFKAREAGLLGRIEGLEQSFKDQKDKAVKEVIKWLMDYSIHGGKENLENVLIDMRAHSKYQKIIESFKESND